jgi:hypothetical protein
MALNTFAPISKSCHLPVLSPLCLVWLGLDTDMPWEDKRYPFQNIICVQFSAPLLGGGYSYLLQFLEHL